MERTTEVFHFKFQTEHMRNHGGNLLCIRPYDSLLAKYKRSMTRDVSRSSAFGHISGLAPDSSPHNSWTSGVVLSGLCGVGPHLVIIQVL